MKHLKMILFLSAMLLGTSAWADDTSSRFSFKYLLDGVEIESTVSTPGSVSISDDGTTTTVTVTPEDGNYFETRDLTVTPNVDAGLAQSRLHVQSSNPSSPGISSDIEVTLVSDINITGEQKFEFTLDGNTDIKYLVTADFHQRISIANATVEVQGGGWIYTGEAHTPEVKVKLNGVYLNPENDFSVSYANNIDAGNGEITVTGIGKYIDSPAVKTFPIAQAPSSIAFAESSVNKVCGDEPFSVTLDVTGNGTISYTSDNQDVATVDDAGLVTVLREGTATITATLGCDDNYSGASTSFSVNVTRKLIEESDGRRITWDVDGYHYVINENEALSMVIGNDYSPVASLTYTRTLWTEGKTAVEIDGEQRFLFTLCALFEPRFNAKFYTLTSVTGSVIRFDQISGLPKAYTPYLVATTKDVAVTPENIQGSIIEPELSRLASAPDESKEAAVNILNPKFDHVVYNTAPVNGYQLKGTLRGLSNTDAADEGAYILQNSGKWGAVRAGNDAVYIPPFRAYIVAENGGNARLDTTIGSGDATAIEHIVTVDLDGTEYWYDLQGRPIAKPSTKGLYIHNGKKIATK